MKVKDIISKCRIRDTSITFIENGKIIEETTMEKLLRKDDHPVMMRTLNTWEVKENKFVIWIKPQ